MPGRFSEIGNLANTFRDARQFSRQRDARQEVANNPSLSPDDRFNRLLGAGAVREASAIANRDLARSDSDFRNKTFAAGREDAEFNRLIARTEFLHRAADRAQNQEDRERARAGLGVVLQREIPEASPEDITAIVDSGQAGAILKTRREASAPLKPADRERIRIQQEELDRKRKIDETKTEERDKEVKLAEKTARNRANVISTQVNKILPLIKNASIFRPVTGRLSDVANFLSSESNASAVRASLKTIAANIGFDELVKLKAQGGTVGALSERELAFLQSLQGNLETDQPIENLKDTLLELRRIARKIDPNAGTFDAGSLANPNNSPGAPKSQARVGQTKSGVTWSIKK